jgi:hypothetical protein
MKKPLIIIILFLLVTVLSNIVPAHATNNNSIFATLGNLKNSISEALQPVKSDVQALKNAQASSSARILQLESEVSQLKSSKRILGYQQYRGNSFTTNSMTDVPTDAKVDITCSEDCVLQVNYYVDTRNTVVGGINSIYTIYLDGVNQSYVNQASAAMEDQANSISLNALIPASKGNHTVQINTRITNSTAFINEHSKTLSIVAFSK